MPRKKGTIVTIDYENQVNAAKNNITIVADVTSFIFEFADIASILQARRVSRACKESAEKSLYIERGEGKYLTRTHLSEIFFANVLANEMIIVKLLRRVEKKRAILANSALTADQHAAQLEAIENIVLRSSIKRSGVPQKLAERAAMSVELKIPLALFVPASLFESNQTTRSSDIQAVLQKIAEATTQQSLQQLKNDLQRGLENKTEALFGGCCLFMIHLRDIRCVFVTAALFVVSVIAIILFKHDVDQLPAYAPPHALGLNCVTTGEGKYQITRCDDTLSCAANNTRTPSDFPLPQLNITQLCQSLFCALNGKYNNPLLTLNNTMISALCDNDNFSVVLSCIGAIASACIFGCILLPQLLLILGTLLRNKKPNNEIYYDPETTGITFYRGKHDNSETSSKPLLLSLNQEGSPYGTNVRIE